MRMVSTVKISVYMSDVISSFSLFTGVRTTSPLCPPRCVVRNEMVMVAVIYSKHLPDLLQQAHLLLDTRRNGSRGESGVKTRCFVVRGHRSVGTSDEEAQILLLFVPISVLVQDVDNLRLIWATFDLRHLICLLTLVVSSKMGRV